MGDEEVCEIKQGIHSTWNAVYILLYDVKTDYFKMSIFRVAVYFPAVSE